MKRNITYLLILLTILSCSRESRDFSGSDKIDPELSYYMMDIADNLVVDNLKALERNLASGSAKTQAQTSVKEYSDALPGLRIDKAEGDSTWILTNEDLDYKLNDKSYPTSYTITARMLPKTAHTFHDWEVSVDGSRTERKGYSCTFTTNDRPLTYSADYSGYSWSTCHGTLLMFIYKDNVQVDALALSLRGDKYNSTVNRIL